MQMARVQPRGQAGLRSVRSAARLDRSQRPTSTGCHYSYHLITFKGLTLSIALLAYLKRPFENNAWEHMDIKNWQGIVKRRQIFNYTLFLQLNTPQRCFKMCTLQSRKIPVSTNEFLIFLSNVFSVATIKSTRTLVTLPAHISCQENTPFFKSGKYPLF